MPVFSSKMTLFGKAGLYTIIGMVSPSATTFSSLRQDMLRAGVSLWF